MDRIDAMTVAVAVGEAGSLSAAARRLRMPLPTVSRRLSDLEAHLNTRLFNRSTRHLTPTEPGQVYLKACKRILEDVSETERAAAGEFSTPKGDLVISAPIVFGRLHVLPMIIAFLKTYPEVQVRLVQSDRLVNLLEDHVDLVVRIGELADSQLIATRCGSTRRVVCASPDYYAAAGTPRNPADLARHSLIAFETLGSADSWSFRAGGASLAIPIRPRLIVNTAEAAIDAALAGAGLTRVLSYQVEAALVAGTLVTALKRFEPPAAPVSLVYTNQRRLPFKVRAFLDFAAPRLRAGLARAG
ncbi:MAG: LysR substrate-binding domain-containing protein [Steroidobacteraceae bacterium]